MFDKEQHIKTMKPYVDKLVDYLEGHGVKFEHVEDNVIFSGRDKVLKISHHCFYRFSGLMVVQKAGKHFELTLVNKDDFINIYMKSVIGFHFKLN